MSLRTGSQLGSYRLLRDFVGGSNCRWTFAESEGREFFVKEFQRPKYPTDSLPGALSVARLARCRALEDRHRRLLAGLRIADDTAGTLVVPVAFFRQGLAYYHVAPRVAPTSLTLPEIARLPASDRLALVRAAARGVMALHAQRIVHGDLKPSNVLADRSRNGALAVRLIDFDGAYFAGEPPDPDEMEFDQAYMAPEVLAHVRRTPEQAGAPPGLAADVFSLGLLIHAYWTGRAPTPAGEHGYAGEAVLAGDGLGIETPDLPPRVERLLRRALSADPTARPAPWEFDAAIGHLPRPAPTEGPHPDSPTLGEAPSGRIGPRGMSAPSYAGPLPPGRSGSPGIIIRKSKNLERDGP